MAEIEVDVRERSTRAARRVGFQRGLQGFLDKPEEPVSRWSQFFKWEHVIVNGREVKGWVVPQPLGIALLVLILAGGIYMWRSFSTEQQSQRDMLIEMKTELRMAKEHDVEYRSEIKNAVKLHKVYIDNVTNQLNTIKGLLTPQQLRYLEQNSRRTEN